MVWEPSRCVARNASCPRSALAFFVSGERCFRCQKTRDTPWHHSFLSRRSHYHEAIAIEQPAWPSLPLHGNGRIARLFALLLPQLNESPSLHASTLSQALFDTFLYKHQEMPTSKKRGLFIVARIAGIE